MRLFRGLAMMLILSGVVACSGEPRRLTATLGDTNTMVTATLDDSTGRIRGINFVWPVPEWAFAADLGEFATRNDSPRVIWMTWTGGTCPTAVAIEATSDGDKFRLAFDPGKRCESDVGKARVLAITFADPTDASTIDVSPLETPRPS